MLEIAPSTSAQMLAIYLARAKASEMLEDFANG
jgi:hypothetical protein